MQYDTAEAEVIAPLQKYILQFQPVVFSASHTEVSQDVTLRPKMSYRNYLTAVDSINECDLHIAGVSTLAVLTCLRANVLHSLK